MPTVIDALKLLRAGKRLPTEAFFVDTNVVIDYVDPFSRSLDNKGVARRNEQFRDVVRYLKSQDRSAFATVSVSLEYYKYVQVGFYLVHTGEKTFNGEAFKQLRADDIEFMDRWEVQMRRFKKVFTRRFPLFDANLPVAKILTDFRSDSCDFGDHVLYTVVAGCEESKRCIFSNDSDFYSMPDDFYLLTTNHSIIERAVADHKTFLWH